MEPLTTVLLDGISKWQNSNTLFVWGGGGGGRRWWKKIICRLMNSNMCLLPKVATTCVFTTVEVIKMIGSMLIIPRDRKQQNTNFLYSLAGSELTLL